MTTDTAEAYPLSWPEGWPRTPSTKRDPGNQFGTMTTVHSTHGSGSWKARRPIAPDRARRLLRDELDRLGAKHIVLSTNVPLRQDGEMRADKADRRLEDPGVAVYFLLKGKQMVMAQDSFVGVAANMRSLGLAIEALRQLDRHGGGTMMERAFAGFTALPSPDGHRAKRPWWLVLNYGADEEARADLTVDEVEARYRALAKKRHPDVDGGSDELMAELNEARDDAVKALGG